MREGWKVMQLGELITTKKGYAFKSAWYQDKGVPVVRVSDFTDNSISDETIFYINEELASEHSSVLLNTKDIIVQTVGSWQHNPASIVGKVVRVPNNLNNSLLNQNAVKLIPNGQIEKDFLYYRLKDESFKYHNLNFAQGAANQASITLETIKCFKINLPPLETQKKIASILSGYDDLIENNLKRIKILEEMAQQTYEEWFVRMRFPGHESATINPETGLPEGWEKVKLGDLCEKIFDGTHDSPKPKESGYKLITGKHLQKGKVDFESAYYISKEDHLKIKKRSGLEKGDIMFSNIGTIGNLSMVTEDFEYSCKNMIVFRPQKDFQYYLYTYLFNENNKNKMISEAAGSTQKFLSLGYIRGFEDLLPSIRLIKHFNEFAENLYITINNLQNQNQRLREARDILLPRLMMGMIEV